MDTAIRLDQYVASHFSLSRAQAAKAIHAGQVRCNGEVVKKPAKIVSPSDHVELKHSRLSPSPSPSSSPIPLLYEDAACIVALKPQDLIVDDLLRMLQKTLRLSSLILVHRLDKGTSGCLLLAKNPESCNFLQEQFKERTVEKVYLALVAGVPQEKEATIEAPVGRSLTDRRRMSLFRTSKSREATTMYRILSSTKKCALLECRILTGRTHQIRVHLCSIGHPILGDSTYATEQSRLLSEEYAITLPCLHAAKLTFRSPATKEVVRIEAPLPEVFQQTIEALHLSEPTLPTSAQ